MYQVEGGGVFQGAGSADRRDEPRMRVPPRSEEGIPGRAMMPFMNENGDLFVEALADEGRAHMSDSRRLRRRIAIVSGTSRSAAAVLLVATNMAAASLQI